MIKRKAILWISFLVVIFLLCVVIFSTMRYSALVTIHGKTYTMEVSDTKYLLEKGLSKHAPLSSSEGMLFVFGTPDKYGFWMKDMLFPLDIIWVSQDMQVVYIEKSLGPDTYPQIFTPDTPAKYVLEVSAGQVEALQIKIGDTVQIVKKWL